ncbi:MAG TPA: glycosyltransferase family 1 protein [Thermoanaerobaculia bacterium]|nr:glycosyltransferase family 1 protein [Thermoanaerobaculia bacterium]
MSKRRSLRVFVDLAPLSPDGGNGGARLFVLDLLGALLARPAAHEIHLLVKPAAEAVVAPLVARGAFLHRLGPGLDVEEPRKILRTRRRLHGFFQPLLELAAPDRASLRRLGADVLFSPLGTAAFHEAALPHVVVAYDFQDLVYPEFFDADERRRRIEFRGDLRRADRVVAISEATKLMAVERVHVKAERISVLPPVAGPLRAPLDPRDAIARLDALGLFRAEYAVYPANFWPHKNHERLLAAAARVAAEDPDFLLVLCGALDEARESLRGKVEAAGLTASIRVLPYLEDADTTALLAGAEFLVFPSLFEGFGIPVLEAMALKTPVACSDLPALLELAGDAALFFDPSDEAGIAQAIRRLRTEDETRDRLVTKGLARAERVAKIDVAGGYHELLGAIGSERSA